MYPFSESSLTLVIPTSTTTTPSFTISALTKFGDPRAEIIISACLVRSAIFLVLLWASVTVEFPGLDFLLIRILMGLPTISERPITSVCFPSVSTLYLSNNSITP